MRRVAILGALVLAASLAAPMNATAIEPEARPAVDIASTTCSGFADVPAVSTAQGIISVPSGSLNGSKVYAYELETGRLTCVDVDSSGEFTLPLPGVGGGNTLRRPVDGWVVSASPPSGSTLGSASRLLTWDSVAVGGTVPGMNLSLQEATVTASATSGVTSTTFPVLICPTTSSEALSSGACAIATGNDASSVVRLAAGGSSYQSVQARGVFDDTALVGYAETQGRSLTVELVAEGEPADCGLSPSVEGTVTREVDGEPLGIVTSVSVEAISPTSSTLYRYWMGSALSRSDGRFRICLDQEYTPSIPSNAQLILAASPITGGVTTVKPLAQSCRSACSGVSVALRSAPSVGGTISLEGEPGSPALSQQPHWTLWKGSLSGGRLSTDYYVTSGITDARGRWGVAFVDGLSPLQNGSYVVEATPTRRTDGYADVRRAFNVTSSQGTADIELQQGNVRGRVLRGTGDATSWSWLNFEPVSCESNCQYGGAGTDSLGWFSLDLADGSYSITAYSWGDTESITTRFSIVVEAGSLTEFMGQQASVPVSLQLRRPNASLVLLKDDTALPYAGISTAKWTEGDNGGSLADSSWRDADESGTVTDFLTAGSYRVVVYPPYDSGLFPVVRGWRVTETAGRLNIEQCSDRPRWNKDPCSAEDQKTQLTTDQLGRWRVLMPHPPVTATVTNPEQNVALAHASVCIEYSQSDDNGNTWNEGSCSLTSSSGTIGLPLSDPGSYKVRVSKPWESTEEWAEARYTFEVDEEGSICARSAAGSCNALTGEQLTLPLKGANLIATVRRANGSPLTSGWVSIGRQCSNYPSCRQWIAHASVSSRGTVAVHLDSSDDTYLILVTPYDSDDGSVATTFPVRVTDEEIVQNVDWRLRTPNVTGTIVDWQGTPMAYTSASIDRQIDGNWIWQDTYGYTDADGRYRLLLEPGTYRLRVYPRDSEPGRAVTTISSPFVVGDEAVTVDVTMRRPNLAGRITAFDGTALPHPWIEVQQWYPAYGYYGWSPDVAGTGASSTGQFGLSLPQGKWRLVVNPPWGNMSVSRTIVPIVSDGTGVCLDDGTSCTSGDYVSSDYVLVMERPNASGYVVLPDGSTRINDAWIEVRRWSAQSSAFVWDFDLPNATTGPQATFALSLPLGRWQLAAHPGGGVVEGTRNAIDVTVGATGLCLTANAPCGSDDTIGPGELRIALLAPNVRGTVTMSGAPVSDSWVYAQRWHSDWSSWEWANAHTSSGAPGGYSLTLTQPGAYRIVARTPGQVRGYVDGRSYVIVDSSGICMSQAPPNGTPPGTDCQGTGDDSVSPETALVPANFVAEVRGEGQPANWTWVQLQERTTDGWYWREGRSTIEDGSVSFDVSVDDTSQFRLYIDPAWNSSGDFTRTYFDFIAYRQTPGGTVSTCAVPDWDASARNCRSVISNTQPAVVNLATSGLRGTVNDPGGSPVAWSWVHAERWASLPWDSATYRWQWDDAYGYSRGNGNFALPLTGPGFFRITAQPRWPNLEGYAKRSQVVEIDDSGRWCLHDPVAVPTADPFGDCEGPLNESSTRVSIQLATSNVIGVLVFDDTVGGVLTSRGMPYGWIQVLDSRGEWVAGLSTSDQGRFALLLDDSDTYTVVGYPNWSFSQRPPIRAEVKVNEAGVVTSGLTGGELILDVDSVPPNVTLTIDGVVGERLIAVERDLDGSASTDNDWVSAPEFNVISLGGSPNIALLTLPEGLYRFSVVPEVGYQISGSSGVTVAVVNTSGQYTATLSVSEAAIP